MPEQISKYPEVTIEVLKSAGAVCGQGGPQNILTQCPAKQFCSLPGGEICVYGISQIPQMTQITLQELAQGCHSEAIGHRRLAIGRAGGSRDSRRGFCCRFCSREIASKIALRHLINLFFVARKYSPQVTCSADSWSWRFQSPAGGESQ